MKIFKRVIIGLLLLVAFVAIGIYVWLGNLKPDFNANLQIPGLKAEVEILYDDYGVPHIYAQNEEDLFCAFGYAQAQDRLFQMEMIRRLADGRLSELFGAKALASDKFFKTLSIRKYAKASVDSVYLSNPNAAFTKAAKAYLRGINHYIKSGKTPIEFSIVGIPKTEFTLDDIELIVGYMGFTFAQAFEIEAMATTIQSKYGDSYLRELMAQWPANEPKIPVQANQNIRNNEAVISPAATQNMGLTLGKMAKQLAKMELEALYPPFKGSNGWLIAGSKTKSGKPILANDTHIAYAQPAVWYEAHLNCPGFNFYGNFLAGTPVAALGHNDFGGWGLTMFENDDMDFFREKSNPQNPKQVWYKDHWETMRTRAETIKIKDEPDYVLNVLESRHGVVLNGGFEGIANEKEPIALWWTFAKFSNRSLEAFYRLAHARNATDAQQAAALMHSPGLNIMWADTTGNIAWWAAAKIPKRPAHVNPMLILDGSTGQDDPTGWFDFAQNPQIINPTRGVLYTANNQAENMGTGYVPGYYVPGDRAKRIEQLLFTDKKDWTVADVRTMINDDVSANYPQLLKDILPLLNAKLLSPTAKSAQLALAGWDGSHGLDNTKPTVFYKFIYKIYQNTFRDELGETLFNGFSDNFATKRNMATIFRNDASVWWDNVNTTAKESRSEILTMSLNQAVIDLEKQLGASNNWQWRRVHTLTHKHPLGVLPIVGKYFNVGPFETPGGREVINNQEFVMDSTGIYNIIGGPALRRVVDMAAKYQSQSVIPTGQSGYLMSKHYNDQASMFVTGGARPELMLRPSIEAVKIGKTVLRP